MGCLGTLVLVACIAAFVVVLIAYPKQALGCGAALLVVAIIGIAAVLEKERKSSEQYRARQDAVTATVAYSPGTCGEGNPLAVTVRNGGSQTLDALSLKLQAFRPGRSTDLLESSYSENTLKWDKILTPGQSETRCYSLPVSVTRSREDAPGLLEWRFAYKTPTFH